MDVLVLGNFYTTDRGPGVVEEAVRPAGPGGGAPSPRAPAALSARAAPH